MGRFDEVIPDTLELTLSPKKVGTFEDDFPSFQSQEFGKRSESLGFMHLVF